MKEWRHTSKLFTQADHKHTYNFGMEKSLYRVRQKNLTIFKLK